MSSISTSSFESLPVDVILHLLKNGIKEDILDIPDIQNLFLVSKKISLVAKNIDLWKFIAFQKIGFQDLEKEPKPENKIGLDLSIPKDRDHWLRFKNNIEQIVSESKNKMGYLKSFTIENILAIKKSGENPNSAYTNYNSAEDFNSYMQRLKIRAFIAPPCMGGTQDFI